MHKSDYRPTLVTLEDRVAPGTTLANALDPSMLLTLGSSLSALDRDLLNASSENRVADLGGTNVDSVSQVALTGADLPIQRASNQAAGSLGTSSLQLGDGMFQDASHLLQLERGLGGGIHSQGVLLYNMNDQQPGTFIRVNCTDITDPTTCAYNSDLGVPGISDTFNNVNIGSDGSVFVAQSDITYADRQITVTLQGNPYDIQIFFRAQSDINGTFDPSSGSMTISFNLDIYLTSNGPDPMRRLPNFDNTNCIVPAASLNMTTDDTGGAQFVQSNDGSMQGIVIDNTYLAHAIPSGNCGGIPFVVDYADAFNAGFGLPSETSGANSLSHGMLLTPQQ
jgi:hypothetical protein